MSLLQLTGKSYLHSMYTQINYYDYMKKLGKVHIDLDSMLRKVKWDTVLVSNLVGTEIAQP